MSFQHSSMRVENKDNFKQIYADIIAKRLTKRVFEHMLSRDSENDYFEIDRFFDDIELSRDISIELVDTLMKELNNLGWGCKTSFGGTGLFIYSTPNHPSNCYDDEF